MKSLHIIVEYFILFFEGKNPLNMKEGKTSGPEGEVLDLAGESCHMADYPIF